LIAYLFYQQLPNLDPIRAALLSADPFWILAAASLHVVGFGLCSFRWMLLLRAQAAAYAMPPLAASYLVGIFFNSFLPGTMSGDVVRAMDTAPGVGAMTRAMVVVVVERLTGMIALLALTAGALAIAGVDVLGHSHVTLFLMGLSGAVLLLAALLFHSGGTRLLSRGVDGIPIARVRRKFHQIAESLRSFAGKGPVLAGCILISLLFQINVVLHYWLIGKALGIEVQWFIYFAYIPVSLLMLMIPASINGIGLREQVFIFLFGNAGVSPVLSVSLAWIAFAMVLIQAVLGGVVFAIRKRMR
jgi:hypothetical protein